MKKLKKYVVKRLRRYVVKRLPEIVVAVVVIVLGIKMVEVPAGRCETITIFDSGGSVRTERQWAPSGTMMKIPSTELPQYWDLRKCNR